MVRCDVASGAFEGPMADVFIDQAIFLRVVVLQEPRGILRRESAPQLDRRCRTYPSPEPVGKSLGQLVNPIQWLG